MRVLFLHSDQIKIEPKEPAIDERDEPEKLSVEESIVVFISVEQEDNEKTVEKLIEEILDYLSRVKAKRVVLYPYAHLSSKLAPPTTARELIRKAYEGLKNKGIEVYKAPFGWYKAFQIKVKGHPLAELSREIKVKEEKKKFEDEFYILKDGKLYRVLGGDEKKLDVVEVDWELNEKERVELLMDEFSDDLRRLIEKEVLKFPFEEREDNPLNNVAKKFGFEWEPMSDYGHMRYKWYAAQMVDLVADYSIKACKEIENNLYVIKGTNMFNLNEKPIAEHAKLFGERMYMVESDKGKFILRYAACFQQFSMLKDMVISYKDLPMAMLEIADSYRFEQSGEVVLAFRLRMFYMPDMHVLVKPEEAEEEFFKLHRKIMDEMKKIGRKYVLLVNVGSLQDLKELKDLLIRIEKDVGEPIVLHVIKAKERIFYWTINIEYHIVDILGRPREIGTVQMDIGNAKRFGIKYIDRDGSEKYPYIIHTAIIGSIERYLYAQMDTALRREKPVLPLWLSPIQVRILPVSEKYNEYALKIAKELEDVARVEVDLRDVNLGKKIRDAETLWVPYIVVIGQKEVEKGTLSLRDRYEVREYKISLEDLKNKLRSQEVFRIQYYPKIIK